MLGASGGGLRKSFRVRDPPFRWRKILSGFRDCCLLGGVCTVDGSGTISGAW